MSFVDSDEVVALRKHITLCMQHDPPPDNCGALVLMSWMSRHLTPEQFKLLERIEMEEGESGATAWLMLILGTSRPAGSPFVAVA